MCQDVPVNKDEMTRIAAGQRAPDREMRQLAENLREAIGRFVRVIRLDASTPSDARMEALAILDSDGAMSVAALAARRAVKHQSMRLLVEQLADDGLVVREADPDDRRSRTVHVTEAGRQLLSRSRGSRASSIASRLQERLSPHERDVVREAIALLKRLGDPVG